MEEPELFVAIWELHDPHPILHAVEPVSFVCVPVDPLHLSVSLALIVLEITAIDVSAGPLELAVPIFLVLFVFSFELVAEAFVFGTGIIICLFSPLAFPVLHAVSELSSVCVSILPCVLSEAVGVAVFILTDVYITVGEEVAAIAVTQA